ncbi:MAG: hypothetical protein ACKVP2_13445 [Burkholderiales bacterium]
MEEKNRLLLPLGILAMTSVIAFSSIGIAAITGHLSITQPSMGVGAFAGLNYAEPTRTTDADAKGSRPKKNSPSHEGLTRSTGESRKSGKSVDYKWGAKLPANPNKRACVNCGVIDSISPFDSVSSDTNGGGEMVQSRREHGATPSGSSKSFVVIIRMENGTIRTIRENQQPSFGVGERVRLVNGSIIPTG